jgi:hypothetical protein
MINCAFLNLVFNVKSISVQSVDAAGSSNINRLPIPILMGCQEFVYG